MRYSNPVPQLSDSDSQLIVGGKLYFYQTNTTTLKTIYADSSLTIPQNNPVVTDGTGSLENIFLDGLYKVVQKDDSGVQLWERDPVGAIDYSIRTADAGGTVDAITAVFDPTIPSLEDEKTVMVRALGANATTTPTFSPDGLTAKTITKNGNQALAKGDIFGLNHVLIFQYNLANDVWELLNPVILTASSVTTAKVNDLAITPVKLSTGQYGGDYIKLSDVQATTVAGGSNIAGTQTRTLNTEDSDTGNNCTLSSNQFTLVAGTYRIQATAPAYAVNRHKAFLYNVTGSVNVIIGTSEFSSNGDTTATRSYIFGEFIIAVSTTFEIRHYTQNVSATNGLGFPGNDGTSEVYTIAELWKLI